MKKLDLLRNKAEKAKRGRPPFKITAAMRRRVSIAAGGGMSHEEIAIALGKSRNWLEKHFERELSVSAYERRVEVMQAMHRSAIKGNVAAQKAYCQMAPHVASVPLEKGKPLGKKEQAQVDATTAEQGTDWNDLLGQNVTPIRKPAA